MKTSLLSLSLFMALFAVGCTNNNLNKTHYQFTNDDNFGGTTNFAINLNNDGTGAIIYHRCNVEDSFLESEAELFSLPIHYTLDEGKIILEIDHESWGRWAWPEYIENDSLVYTTDSEGASWITWHVAEDGGVRSEFGDVDTSDYD